MTRRQLELAAKLYGLAAMAHLDLGCADTDDDAKVMRLAAKRAQNKLHNLGVSMSDLITIGDCIDKAREIRP